MTFSSPTYMALTRLARDHYAREPYERHDTDIAPFPLKYGK